ncbi:MAG: molybdenum cofactor guanylyltransferase MobA [Thiohalomonadaceae bacterium]
MNHRPRIQAVVLAGGLGRRMGGRDKGLLPLTGRPLVAHVLAALAPQVDELVISTPNPEYAAFGLPLLADAIPGRAGPLAGILATLEATDADLVLSVPCDTPHLPGDLVQRLLLALDGHEASAAADEARLHPVIALWRPGLAGRLRVFLESGERRAGAWLAGVDHAVVRFDAAGFVNANTPEDLESLQ